jgi:hypothetical protein
VFSAARLPGAFFLAGVSNAQPSLELTGECERVKKKAEYPPFKRHPMDSIKRRRGKLPARRGAQLLLKFHLGPGIYAVIPRKLQNSTRSPDPLELIKKIINKRILM